MPKKLPKIGRPTNYRPAICSRVICFGKLGFSRCQIAAELNICWKLLQDWEKAHPEFLAAMIRARELSQAWWEKAGQKGIKTTKNFNANAYRLQVINRFPQDWRDRPGEVSVTVNNETLISSGKSLDEMSREEIRAELARREALPLPSRNGQIEDKK